MSKIPPYLKKGDKIGIVAPAGYMAIKKCRPAWKHWMHGVTPLMPGITTHSHSNNYFSCPRRCAAE